MCEGQILMLDHSPNQLPAALSHMCSTNWGGTDGAQTGSRATQPQTMESMDGLYQHSAAL